MIENYASIFFDEELDKNLALEFNQNRFVPYSIIIVDYSTICCGIFYNSTNLIIVSSENFSRIFAQLI
jgi:hypothetical protein